MAVTATHRYGAEIGLIMTLISTDELFIIVIVMIIIHTVIFIDILTNVVDTLGYK